jgi:hypothetical protein
VDFTNFLDKDITCHTDNHKYRGVLVDVLVGVLALKMGVDDFFIDASKIIGVTLHGREFGKESND